MNESNIERDYMTRTEDLSLTSIAEDKHKQKDLKLL